jgi:hypothetical protein
MTCSNDIGNCGGNYANAIYEVTSGIPTALPSSAPVTQSPTQIPTAPVAYQYIGCYGDSPVIRAFTTSYGITATVSTCYNLALSNGYKYFGLQYGGECWVTNTYANAVQYNQCPASTGAITDCNCAMPCPGGELNCGGSYSNAVYSLNANVNIVTTAPSRKPSSVPSVVPSLLPSVMPSVVPSRLPSLAPVKPALPYQLLGCYGDNIATRAFSLSYGILTSVLACYTNAAQNNYKYFGIQFGG